MKRFSFTDADLRCAAAVVCDAMLKQLPEPSECHHTFSDEFEQKIKELAGRKKNHRALRRFAKRAAAVILAVLIGAGAWLLVAQEARAAVVRWIREVYEDSVFYYFSGDAPTEGSCTYELTWVPDGYEKVGQIGDDITQTVIYQKGTDTFTFICHKTSEGSLAKLFETNGAGEIVSINGITGYYYPAANSTTTSDLIWVNDKDGILCCVSANLCFEDMLHIAESAKLVKMAK